MTEVKNLMVLRKYEQWKRQRWGEKVEGERKLGTEMERGRENVLTEVSRNGEGRKIERKRENSYK